MNAQEANGEQREKNGGKFAETDDFGRAVLKRKPPETAPTLGKRAKKIPTDKGWDFTLWWSWRDAKNGVTLAPQLNQINGLRCVFGSTVCNSAMRLENVAPRKSRPEWHCEASYLP